MKFKLCEVEFEKRKLDILSLHEQAFLFQISHAVDEISLIQKCLLLILPDLKSEVETIRKIQQNHFFSMTYLFAGKINEGWQVIHKVLFCNPNLRGLRDKLSAETDDCLKKIKKYFSTLNLVAEIRNKFSFHYDTEKIIDEIKKIPGSELLKMYIAPQSGNSHLNLGSLITSRAFLNMIPGGNDFEVVSNFVNEINEVGRLFQSFGHGLTTDLLKNIVSPVFPKEIEDKRYNEKQKIPCFFKPQST